VEVSPGKNAAPMGKSIKQKDDLTLKKHYGSSGNMMVLL
jgi:hypothetical protein